MTRAAEFCYIAERAEGVYLMALCPSAKAIEWTPDMEMALRMTPGGRSQVQMLMAAIKEARGEHPAAYSFGFRKVLAG